MVKNMKFSAKELQLEESEFRKLIASRLGINERDMESYSMQFIKFSESEVNYQVHVSIRGETA